MTPRPRTTTTRRQAIAAATAAAAATAFPTSVAAGRRQDRTRTRRRRHVDVAIVGAGLAGLTAARALARAGRSTLVFEARARVGGRTLNHPLGQGEAVEVGGQFVGPTQDRLLALAHELGVDTFATNARGRNVFYAGGRRSTYREGPIAFPPDIRFVPLDPTALELSVAFAALDAMAARVPVQRPWDAARAADWDSQTVETWKRAHLLTPSGRGIFDTACQGLGFEPREASLLSLAWFVAAAGDETHAGTTGRLFGTTGGAQERRFVGGSQLLSIRATAELGDAVVLNAPVERIAQAAGRVKVHCARVTAIAARAIVAIPPVLAARIDYVPRLPAAHEQLLQRLAGTTLVKCSVVYDRPFWRDRGLTGMAAADRGALRVTFDNTPPDGAPGVLMGFIGGAESRRWASQTPSERRATVLHDLSTYFGEQALLARGYHEQIWTNEPWSRGAGTLWPPGVLIDAGPQLDTPAGRIHWAGAETASYWNGYMERAVRSGERAAHEVLEQL